MLGAGIVLKVIFSCYLLTSELLLELFPTSLSIRWVAFFLKLRLSIIRLLVVSSRVVGSFFLSNMSSRLVEVVDLIA